MKSAKLMALTGLAGAAVVSGLAALMKNDVVKIPPFRDAVQKQQDETRKRQEEEARRRRAIKRKDDYFRKRREEAARQARSNNHD
ncbi:hypothetical protein KBP30_14440 [Streptomyces sp. Go40/10]|uniref:hypothetical protein n=1 Tax=Streptomyces sp. Go40/10 TaxID=2825844 RepID=UPI001E2BDC53|nr:hypothetical protein [Streptomyces sp. Go40/10]UFR02310.1 hypothetical protein KBP30_14440 [Streptomyces sp. Go40/10]